MDLRRHAVAAAIALLWFLAATLVSGGWGLPALIASLVVVAVCTVLFFHYRRGAAVQELAPVTPARDDRVIPHDVRVAVIARDKGKCQLRYPGICLVDADIQIDHIWPWSRGGSSKDIDNLQCACGPCNRHKSDSLPV